MKAVVIIPARYGSERLPGKVLLKKSGKYLVQHTYEQVRKAKQVDRVVVATDEPKVLKAVKTFGGEAVLTSRRHRSGTERVAEVARKLRYNLIVNVQADEPEINPSYIDLVIKLLRRHRGMATLTCLIERTEDLLDPNKVKVVLDKNHFALYFSRSPITYYKIGSRNLQVASRSRRLKPAATLENTFLRHLGIYAYRKEVLLSLVRMPPSPLEKLEKLEQLRALENGIKIKVGIVKSAQPGIDTLKDYQAFLQRLRTKKSGRSGK